MNYMNNSHHHQSYIQHCWLHHYNSRYQLKLVEYNLQKSRNSLSISTTLLSKKYLRIGFGLSVQAEYANVLGNRLQ